METVQKELERILKKEQILQNEPMDRHTTFRVGGPADILLQPTAESLPEVMKFLHSHKVPVTVIGNGSNLLVADKGVRGVVIEVGKQLADVCITEEYVTAQAGALLSKVSHAAYKKGLSGMEFAAGIPGSIGGAVVMNAGAYGGEMKDIVHSVTVLKKDGTVSELSNEQMEFAYRHSCAAENEYLVISVTLCLHKSKPERIIQKMEELKEQRVKKQPLEYPSAGSTFKRPEGYFAGKLIMDAGLSGALVGGAQVSEKHCGFVINKGGATAADILALIQHIQKTVKEQFGVELQTEVKLLGEF